MYNVKVELGGNTYPLFIGIDILPKLGEIYQLYGLYPRAVLITDLNLKESRYFDTVCENVKKRNININPIFLTDQQVENGFPTIQQIVLRLIKHQFQPGETIISLGGSQVGNISAFVSQILYGGVPYFQIPTTLTAMVLQSVDKMSRLNLGSILNLISIRYEHSFVWSDVSVLKSLPEKNFVNGLGYIVHYACLVNNEFFKFLENNLEKIFELYPDSVEEMVFRSCEAKIKLFKQSQGEQKISTRQAFGEVVASILIESTQNKIKFGEALLFGMIIEGIISFRKGIFNGPCFERFYELLKRILDNYSVTQIDQHKFIDFFKSKSIQNKLPYLSLPQEFGKFITYADYKLSDFISAVELILSN